MHGPMPSGPKASCCRSLLSKSYLAPCGTALEPLPRHLAPTGDPPSYHGGKNLPFLVPLSPSVPFPLQPLGVFETLISLKWEGLWAGPTNSFLFSPEEIITPFRNPQVFFPFRFSRVLSLGSRMPGPFQFRKFPCGN